MMKMLRVAFEKVRLLAVGTFIAGAVCAFIPGTSAAFSAASLTGGYGCLGKATINDNTGTLTGISELLRLNFNGAGAVSGVIVLNLQGEVCRILTTGTYNVNPGGLGSLNLAWNSATGDTDGDTNCAILNSEAVTQHTDLVIEAGGNAFDIQEQDDFLSATTITTDSDVQNPFVGTCRKQWS
jgi:hypothetical protein